MGAVACAVLNSLCDVAKEEGDPSGAPTSGWACEGSGSWDAGARAGGASPESQSHSEEAAEAETKEDADGTRRDGGEVDGGAEERRGDREEDPETGDVGERVELEGVPVSEWWWCWGGFDAAPAAGL